MQCSICRAYLTKIKERFRQHKSQIKNKKLTTYLYNHFCSENHSSLDCRVQIIDYLECNSEEVNRSDLMSREDYWIKTLRTAYPFGLNDRVKGFEDMNKLDLTTLNCFNTPFYNRQSGIYRRRRSHGHRKTRKLRQFRNTTTKELIKDLLALFSKSRHSLLVALKGFSLKHVMRINEFLGLQNDNSELSIPKDFHLLIMAHTSTVRKPQKVKTKDRLFCSIPFVHKI